jgi:histidine-containing phosphotransfer protein
MLKGLSLWLLSSFRFLSHVKKWEQPLLTLVVSVCSCMRSFQKVKREHGALRQKLEAYFQVIIRHKSHPSFCSLCHEPRIWDCVNTHSCYDKLVLLELPPGLGCKNYELQENGVWPKKLTATNWPSGPAGCCAAIRDQHTKRNNRWYAWIGIKTVIREYFFKEKKGQRKGWEPCVAVSLQACLKDGIIVSCVIYSFPLKINQFL